MTQKTLYANEIKNADMGRDELFSVKEIQKHLSKNGDPYFRVVLKDRTGIVQGKVWKDSVTETNVENIQVGDAVAVDFEAQTYNGELQLILKKMNKLSEYDVTQLVNMSPKDLSEQWTKIEAKIDSMEDKELKGLLNKIFSDTKVKDAYQKSPAAEFVHHDFIGGLMEHVLEMMSMAEALIQFYPIVDRSMVLTGILLHDIGKIYELALNETTFERTKAGYLLGHIAIGTMMINEAIPENFDENRKMALEHIILSHHEELEWGAVVKPATIEAMIVAVVDRASGNVRQCEKEIALADVDRLGFGKYNKQLKTKIFIGTPVA